MAVTLIKNATIGCGSQNTPTYPINPGSPATTFNIPFNLGGQQVGPVWYNIVDDVNEITNWATILPYYSNEPGDVGFRLTLKGINAGSIMQINIYAEIG